jgi:tape measure domain-containing protein
MADSYQVMLNKISVVVPQTNLAAQALERVKQIAIETRAPLDQTAQAFSRFALAMKANGRDTEQAFKMTKTVNQLLATSGATAGEAGSALLQFSQALNKGKLDGDEFRTAMELMPTAMDAIAREMGVTRSELIKLAPEGKITSDIMIRAFESVAESADKKFGGMKVTIGQALTNINSQVTTSISKFLTLSGATGLVADSLQWVTKNFKVIGKVMGAALVTTASYLAVTKSMVLWETAKAFAVSSAAAAVAAKTAVETVATEASAANTVAEVANTAVKAVATETTAANTVAEAANSATKTVATTVTTRQTVAIVASTAATKAWNLVLKLNPMALLITSLVAFVAYHDEVIDAFASMTTAASNYFKSMRGQDQALGVNQLVEAYNEDPGSLSENDRASARKFIEMEERNKKRAAKKAKMDEDELADHERRVTKLTRLSNEAIDARKTWDQFQSENSAAMMTFKSERETLRFKEDYIAKLEEGAEADKKAAKEAKANARAMGEAAEKAESRADALALVNKKLDDEVARMVKLKSVREGEAAFDQISQGLLSKKIQLNDAEAAQIRAKIANVAQLTRIQQEYDTIVERANGQQTKYRDSVDAANVALDQGVITRLDFIAVMNRERDALAQVEDNFYDFNKAYERQLEILSFGFGVRDVETKLLDERNRLMKEGMDIAQADEEVAKIREKAYEMERLVEADKKRLALYNLEQAYLKKSDEFSMKAQALQNTRGGVVGQRATNVNTLASDIGVDTTATTLWANANVEATAMMYEKIRELRQKNLIDEQTANTLMLRARLQHQNKYLSVASEFFSNFEGMQRSSSEEMAAIGKAAAIANATVQTYTAATAAYAAMAGIPYVGPALGAAAAAGAIASGMANIAQISAQPTGGFKSGGYTGNGGVNDVAGVVHGREFVFDAASTSRIGRGNLEAMQNGTAMPSGGPVALTLNVAVVSDRAEAERAQKGAAGDKIIVEAIGRNARTIKKVIQSA